MMFFKVLVGRWIAYHIQKAIHNINYGLNTQYLCVVLERKFGLGPRLARWYIMSCIRPHTTVHRYLFTITGERLPCFWPDRKKYHMAFYQFICWYLRHGDFERGRNVTAQDLGLEQFVDKEIDEYI